MSLIPCLGGWCASREVCQHYHATDSRFDLVERLCGDVEEPEFVSRTWIQLQYVPPARSAHG